MAWVLPWLPLAQLRHLARRREQTQLMPSSLALMARQSLRSHPAPQQAGSAGSSALSAVLSETSVPFSLQSAVDQKRASHHERAMALRVAFTSCQISYSKAIPPPLPPPPLPHPPASRHPPCPHRHPRTSSLLMRYVSHHSWLLSQG